MYSIEESTCAIVGT